MTSPAARLAAPLGRCPFPKVAGCQLTQHAGEIRQEFSPMDDDFPDVTDPNEPDIPTTDHPVLTGGTTNGTENYPRI